MTSDSAGEFAGFWLVAPGKYEIFVKADKTGYLEVVGEAAQGKLSQHAIIAILVKNSGESR